MKKHLLFFILFTCTTLSTFAQKILDYQENDNQIIAISPIQKGFLIKNDWHCYQVFIEKRNEETLKYIRIKLDFSEGNHLKQNVIEGNWKIERDSFLFLSLNNFDERKENHLLRGYYGINELTDSTLTLTRILTTSADYRYTYYFENTRLKNARKNSSIALKTQQANRFKEFNQQYKQGLTILEETPRLKRAVVVSQKNCGYYDRQINNDGSVLYSKDGIPITKFDYDYDLRIANEIRSSEVKKSDTKADRFMRGERNE